MLGADAKPREVDQANGDGAHALSRVGIERHVLRHPLVQLREALPEMDQPVVLLTLLRLAGRCAVAVLAPSGAVDADRLQLGASIRGDPDFAPCG
jgi:hypothetical protein